MDVNYFESSNISPEALNLTELELNTWKFHDKKLPHMLMSAMAKLYKEIYPISLEDAFEILEPWISAVWWHDVAETAEDGGMTAESELYWEKVRKGLHEHYTLLVSKLELDVDGAKIAEHDFERWVAHHRREYERYTHHDASIVAGLSDIPYEQAYHLGKLRADAVWMHNDTHLETGISEKGAQELWEETFLKLTEFYETYLRIDRAKKLPRKSA